MKLVIIGGGAGGPAAAARARRLDEHAEIVMLERGDHVSYGHCGLPYYIGGVIRDRDKLLITTPEDFRKMYKVEAKTRNEVKSIDRENKTLQVVDLRSGETYTETYDKLLLATGASPTRPPLPGIDMGEIFTLRTMTDADAIHDFIKTNAPKEAVVVGGGFIGLEMVENLVHLGMKTTIVEMLDQVMPTLDREMADMIQKNMMLHGVDLALSDLVERFSKSDGKVIVHLKSGREIPCDLVILSVGVKPNTELAAQAGLEIGEKRGIRVDERMQTSDPDIYAVGDAVETRNIVTGEYGITPLGGPANRQARIAADNIFGRDSRYRGSLGTSLVKVFDVTAGSTGANEKTLRRLGIKYEKCYLHPFSHANYYPNARQMNFKLIFSPEDGRIFGAQIVGRDGVDKQIDVISTAIFAGMTVADLEHLELGYVPQYGSAKSPINMAGYVASNIRKGDVKIFHWEEINELQRENAFFLDVRKPDEVLTGLVPGAKHIPLAELRDRLDELPRDRTIYTYCGMGIRSYTATRALNQLGFDARNMSGGYGTYKCVAMPGDSDEVKACLEFGLDPGSVSVPESPAATEEDTGEVIQLDACGLQCPGPIMEVKRAVERMNEGDVLEVSASDPGFAKDLPAWSRSMGHEVLSVEVKDGKVVGRIRKAAAKSSPSTHPQTSLKEKSMIVFSNDLDKAMAAFIIANGAASMGNKVNMFFTFWGLNLLRKPEKVKTKKSFMEKMFGWMMPRGAGKVKLSKMNMGGMGTAMMKSVMRKKNVNSLEELIESAMQNGVRIIACTMTMGIMGLKKEELFDGIEEGGVATFLESADRSNVTLFI